MIIVTCSFFVTDYLFFVALNSMAKTIQYIFEISNVIQYPNRVKNLSEEEEGRYQVGSIIRNCYATQSQNKY